MPSTFLHLRSNEIDGSVTSLGLGDEIIACLRRALTEDIGSGDVTTNSIVSSTASAEARIVAKQDGVLSGLSVVQAVFLLSSSDMRFQSTLSDGAQVVRGQTLLEISGSARAILTGERTALNFLARMSGIATLTRAFVDAIAGTGAAILDTRKTAPGLRAIDKLAVKHGGGVNHRFGLYDMVLIKDNHIDYAGSLTRAVELARAEGHNLEIEVEARTIEEVQAGFGSGSRANSSRQHVDRDLRQAVALNAGRAKLEASGNVNLEQRARDCRDRRRLHLCRRVDAFRESV